MNKKIIYILSMLSLSINASALFVPQIENVVLSDDKTYISSFCGNEKSENNSAIYAESELIKSWASGYSETNTKFGTDVDDKWKVPSNAYGKATTSDATDIVCLGNNGYLTMTFDYSITNGSSYDFVVFENGFDNFLELAYVEVSSDGLNFIRFPNFYLGDKAISAYASSDPTQIYNLGLKYSIGYGNGYDLSELTQALEYANSNDNTFSKEYSDELNKMLSGEEPLVDINDIRYVKIVDIVGDGTAVDSEGYAIYDPTPTWGSGGFDLAGIGVINQVPEPSEYGLVIGILSMLATIYARKKNNLKNRQKI